MESDLCKECGAESDIGCVGVSQGQVYHYHYCVRCYNRQKLDGNIARSEPKYPDFRKLGIQVRELNGGVQLELRYKITVADFWPTTGHFKFRNSGIKGVGKDQLLEIMGAA